MDDLISRQAAIDNLERYRELFSWDDGDRERAILSRVIKELQSMPSAEKKGKWIPQDHNYKYGNVSTCLYFAPVCSECGNSGDFNMNYCPNCGARMEE